MKETLTPEERAYQDALADAVEMGVHGEEASRYADRMRGTVWFQGRTLHHAGRDVAAAYRASAESVVARLRALMSRP